MTAACGGGGVHTNSFAMIMFLCVCGGSLHLARCRLFMG